MHKKVNLNVTVNPELRALVKIQAVERNITMAQLVELIIVEWERSLSSKIST